MSFEIQIHTDDDHLRMALSGEIDLAVSPRVRDALLACLGNGQAVEVDLSAVSYIDSSGVATLVEGLQLARQQGVDFTLSGVGGTVMKVLKLARLDEVFTIRQSPRAVGQGAA